MMERIGFTAMYKRATPTQYKEITAPFPISFHSENSEKWFIMLCCLVFFMFCEFYSMYTLLQCYNISTRTLVL